jgi:hypothetical protein
LLLVRLPVSPCVFLSLSPTDSPRPLEAPALERVMSANNENRNELLTATVILTNPMRTSVMGVSFLTRRMNVIAEPLQNKDEVQVAESDSKLNRKHPVLEKKDERKQTEETKVEEKKLDDQK